MIKQLLKINMAAHTKAIFVWYLVSTEMHRENPDSHGFILYIGWESIWEGKGREDLL